MQCLSGSLKQSCEVGLITTLKRWKLSSERLSTLPNFNSGLADSKTCVLTATHMPPSHELGGQSFEWENSFQAQTTNLYKVLKSSPSVGWGLTWKLTFLGSCPAPKEGPLLLGSSSCHTRCQSCRSRRGVFLWPQPSLSSPWWTPGKTQVAAMRAWPRAGNRSPTSLDVGIKWNRVETNLPSITALSSFISNTSKSEQVARCSSTTHFNRLGREDILKHWSRFLSIFSPVCASHLLLQESVIFFFLA